jgi:hypothetical protein
MLADAVQAGDGEALGRVEAGIEVLVAQGAAASHWWEKEGCGLDGGGGCRAVSMTVILGPDAAYTRPTSNRHCFFVCTNLQNLAAEKNEESDREARFSSGSVVEEERVVVLGLGSTPHLPRALLGERKK